MLVRTLFHSQGESVNGGAACRSLFLLVY